jgi:hypothetical protein
VPSTTNVCNLALHLKTTLEYLKPTPDRPNSGQKIFPTTTNTKGTSINRGTKHTKHNEERHKKTHYLGFTLHEESHHFLMLPTTCNGPGFRAKLNFPHTIIFNENSLSRIAQKDKRNQNDLNFKIREYVHM